MSLFYNGTKHGPSLQDQSSQLFLYFASVIGSGKNFVHDYNWIVQLFSRNPLYRLILFRLRPLFQAKFKSSESQIVASLKKPSVFSSKDPTYTCALSITAVQNITQEMKSSPSSLRSPSGGALTVCNDDGAPTAPRARHGHKFDFGTGQTLPLILFGFSTRDVSRLFRFSKRVEIDLHSQYIHHGFGVLSDLWWESGFTRPDWNGCARICNYLCGSHFSKLVLYQTAFWTKLTFFPFIPFFLRLIRWNLHGSTK